MSKRKPYNNKAGYVCSLRSGINKGWVVVYEAEPAGIDAGDCKYAVVCETHGAIVGATSVPKARVLLKSVEFCEECQDHLQ